MSENDKVLVERSKLGDIEAFEKLIEGYQKKVFNIALRMIGNHDDASELSQEVFIRVYKSIGRFKEESAFSTWIYKVTTNVCLDEIRRRKNKKVISLEENIKFEGSEVKRQIEDEKPGPEDIAETNEVRNAVKDAIRMLSEEHKAVIIMRDFQGLSYEEIARITQIPEGTVKSRINRARQALKELLKNKRELFRETYVK